MVLSPVSVTLMPSGRVNTAEVLPSSPRLVISVQASSKPRPSSVGLSRRSKMPETGSSPVGSKRSSTVTWVSQAAQDGRACCRR